ncbi:MAG: hypothetical protein K2X82_08845 [Gemmataceae bacterium]|nr:hypothetical protein [Gemmataceae bacterium]
MNEIPEVRHFIACDGAGPSADGRHHDLTNVFQVVVPRAGDRFPLLRPRVCLYTILTNGRGVHTFAAALVRGVGPAEVEVGRSGGVTRDLGQDPLAIHGLPFPLANLVLGEPGQYEFQLLCDGRGIARAMIEVRAT